MEEDENLLLHLVTFLTSLHHPAPHLRVNDVEAMLPVPLAVFDVIVVGCQLMSAARLQNFPPLPAMISHVAMQAYGLSHADTSSSLAASLRLHALPLWRLVKYFAQLPAGHWNIKCCRLARAFAICRLRPEVMHADALSHSSLRVPQVLACKGSCDAGCGRATPLLASGCRPILLRSSTQATSHCLQCPVAGP